TAGQGLRTAQRVAAAACSPIALTVLSADDEPLSVANSSSGLSSGTWLNASLGSGVLNGTSSLTMPNLRRTKGRSGTVAMRRRVDCSVSGRDTCAKNLWRSASFRGKRLTLGHLSMSLGHGP